jgi:threonine dehydrogenase-like Zn-dependent dehydrogenase
MPITFAKWMVGPADGPHGTAPASRDRATLRPRHKHQHLLQRRRQLAALLRIGSEPGIRSSLAAARPEGTVIVVGGGRSGLDPIAIILKELRVLGSFTYADEFAAVIALLADERSKSPT